MRIIGKLIFFLLITIATLVCGLELQKSSSSSRKKRFVIFPEGTVVQLVYCYLMSALGTEGIFTVGVTLGTNWDVPENLDKLIHDENKKIVANRRDRRSLYPRIEYILNRLGLDGKSCIRKLLCDSRERHSSNEKKKLAFVDEIVHTIFLYPSLPKRIFEPIDEYDYILHQCAQTQAEGCR